MKSSSGLWSICDDASIDRDWLIALIIFMFAEGHAGMDGRFYLLDMARAFPPENPSATPHLSDLLEDGTSVMVFKCADYSASSAPFGAAQVVPGVINKAHMTGHYDIVLESGEVLFRVHPKFIRARCLSVFWRFLR